MKVKFKVRLEKATKMYMYCTFLHLGLDLFKKNAWCRWFNIPKESYNLKKTNDPLELRFSEYSRIINGKYSHILTSKTIWNLDHLTLLSLKGTWQRDTFFEFFYGLLIGLLLNKKAFGIWFLITGDRRIRKRQNYRLPVRSIATPCHNGLCRSHQIGSALVTKMTISTHKS